MGEARLRVELDPVGVMEISHLKLNYHLLSNNTSPLYLWNGVGSIAKRRHQSKNQEEKIGRTLDEQRQAERSWGAEGRSPIG
jgi:hypothetical protein